MGLYKSAYWLSSFTPIVFVSALAAIFLSLSSLIIGEYMNFTVLSLHSLEYFSFTITSFVHCLSISAFSLLFVSCFSGPILINLYFLIIFVASIVFSFLRFNSPFLPFMSYPDSLFQVLLATNLNYGEQFEFNHSLHVYSGFFSYTCMSILSELIYLSLACYLSQVIPTEDGYNLPLYFPFMKSYWTGKSKSESSRQILGDSILEAKAESLKSNSVEIRSISKMFKKAAAVKEFTATFEMGKVYGILGQNGSGKTTLINMLSGVTNPTYGEAFLFGLDVKEDMSQIRSISGICSQVDLFYPKLTAAEHVKLYVNFRHVNLGNQSLDQYVDEKLELVQLTDVKNQQVHGYSGGMKRRLSVALSTIGNDLKIIFLDEPTVFLF